MKAICLFLAEGFEEVEALLPLDILRRGGLNVRTVSVTGSRSVKGAHQVSVVADLLFEELVADDVAMIVLPGGMPGATNLDAHAGLDRLVRDFAAAGRPMAAICAAGLGQAGLAERPEGYVLSGFRILPGRSGMYRSHGRDRRQLRVGQRSRCGG